MNQQKSGTYHYQKITTTTRTVRNPTQNNYSTQNRTVTTTTNSRTVNKPTITVTELNSKTVQYAKCNKCGKLKFSRDQKQIINEQGGWSKRTDITTKSVNKYDKYNKAAHAKCICGKMHTDCTCGKSHRSTSVTTTMEKRSLNAGNVDLTPKLKVVLNPEKIKKAVEEQKRIAEEEKRRRESRTQKVNERTIAYSREENYTYNKTTERIIRDEDLCHCGDENCRKHEEELMRKRREEELRRARLMEEQRLKRIEEERIRKQKLEEEERERIRKEEEEKRRRKIEEERRKREAEERRRR